jgi:hypothetical protein
VVHCDSLPLSFAFGFDFPFPSIGLVSSLHGAFFSGLHFPIRFFLLCVYDDEFICSFVAATYDERGECKPGSWRMMGHGIGHQRR